MPRAPKLASFPAIRGALKFYQVCSIITGTMLLLLLAEMILKYTPIHVELFAGGSTLVRSDALVRLSISPATPPVLLAFGSRDPHRFDTGQATELIDFLGSVLEHVIRIWLHLPD